MLEGLIGGLALVDETPEKMGEVHVEWVDKDPGFISKDDGLLLG